MRLSPQEAFTLIWFGFLVMGIVSASAVLLWAIRSGQFGDQEHARSLPLLSGIPDDDPEMDRGTKR
jgi:cbb3-type cytochrome oxidase maturation protein